MLKITVYEGRVFLHTEKEMSKDEEAFFFECFHRMVHWDCSFERFHGMVHWDCSNEDCIYTLVLSETSASANVKTLNRLANICDDFEIQLPDKFFQLLSKIGQAADEEERKMKNAEDEKKQLDEWNEQIKKASRRMTGGCGFCSSLILKDGEHYCTAAERFCEKDPVEEEREFYTKREAQRTGEKCEYYATAYPCVNCPEMVQGRRALELRTEYLASKEK